MANADTGSCNATRDEYTDSAGISTAAPASAAASPVAASCAHTTPASTAGAKMENLKDKLVFIIENQVNNQAILRNQDIVS
ncbi:hypothetical protein AW736_24545 [Termitidicoccus mucosus]|uniref:Uncharacterized protein n=1 Tax=Termitidicoccus mucosus TaxID=1184151 RepID=A0A178ID85_9BACT|nr:hypothetical protein AW736_24545 [Opitutaceae bacterium TSB47]